MSDEDTRLMRRVAAGDVAAFESLVGRVLPRLLGYFRRLGADASIAEDCAQEVMLKIYRARERYRPRARFITYLFHVARNHWIDVYRHRKVGPVTISADACGGGEDGRGMAAELPSAPHDPSSSLERQELAMALQRAIDGLSPDHREVFLLAQVESLRYHDIAEILDVPVGTVKSRMHAAVRQVREALSRRGFEP